MPVEPVRPNLDFDFRFDNEKDFHEWFDRSCFLFGVKNILSSDVRCPDVIVEMYDGRILKVELEYHANNCKAHGHEPYRCDLVIALAKHPDQTAVRSVPVLAVFDVTGHKTGSTKFNWRSRKLTPEFQEIVRRQSEVVARLLR